MHICITRNIIKTTVNDKVFNTLYNTTHFYSQQRTLLNRASSRQTCHVLAKPTTSSVVVLLSVLALLPPPYMLAQPPITAPSGSRCGTAKLGRFETKKETTTTKEQSGALHHLPTRYSERYRRECSG